MQYLRQLSRRSQVLRVTSRARRQTKSLARNLPANTNLEKADFEGPAKYPSNPQAELYTSVLQNPEGSLIGLQNEE